MTSRTINSFVAERPDAGRLTARPARLAPGLGLLIAGSVSMAMWVAGAMAVRALMG